MPQWPNWYERREMAIAAAAAYEGPGRPPSPTGPLLGRVLMGGMWFRGKFLPQGTCIFPTDPLMENEFRAREKRQARTKLT